jgi:hypothetical protein
MNDVKKVCSKCGSEKTLDEFYKQKNGYLGRRADCKVCSISKTKQWKLKVPNYDKEYRLKNRERINRTSLKYYYKHQNDCQEKGRVYYENNKTVLNEYSRNYYKKNKKELNEYCREWRKNNVDKCRKYARERNHKTLELAAIKWMRNFLYRTEQYGFNKTKNNVITEFGYTPNQLIQRIECQFKEGMSWNNRKYWHIDHKKPISKFKKGTSPKIINMLCNLQPIWGQENLSKSNKF